MSKRAVQDAFTERFKLALHEAGYADATLKELSKLFGVSAQGVNKWKTGEAMPGSERLPKVADVLGVRRAWLRDGELPMRALQAAVIEDRGNYTLQPVGISLSGSEFKLLSQLRGLPRKMQLDIADLIEGVSSALGKANRD